MPKFLPGQSGNPAGRPVGSKNKVNILKIAMEEGFRDGNMDKIAEILNSVVDDAASGDKQARKMIWDACISKANLGEDKQDKDQAPQITIKHMEVKKEGDIIELEPLESEDE